MAENNHIAVMLDHDAELGTDGDARSPSGMERRLSGSGRPAAFDLEQSGDNERQWLLKCSGHWNIGEINEVDVALNELDLDQCKSLTIDSTAAISFDTAGAWMIERLRLAAERHDIDFVHHDEDRRRSELVEVITQPQRLAEVGQVRPLGLIYKPFERVGQATIVAGHDIVTACYLVGASIRGPQMKAGRRGGIRLKSIIHHLDQMGLRAIPVIAVMSFLIGAIIAQQGAYQLQFYGEELLTVNLVGLLHFREIGVLLTAVMVAGRTGSAITAELGTMKMREEIDALTVIGLNPVGVLIFPRLVALIIALPILVVLSDIAGMFGAIVISDLYIGITPEQFLSTLRTGIDDRHFFVGLIKAPVMAVIIGLAAAVEGLKVEGSAESLGRRTTAAVVRAIFAVIVVDGLFAIFFAAIGY
ncbi:MAG: ABC transporter permease [Rhizobiaceae bacterium]